MSGTAKPEGEKGKKAPAKAKKPPKPAKIFRKPIAEEAFEKRYIGLLEQGADRSFLESSFALSEGKLRLKEGMDRDSMIRLNKLGKAIVANRGVVKMGPLVLAALLAAAIAIFALFFMNPFLERAVERGLEAAFGARAEVAAFRLDLFRLTVSMRSIAVADRDEPMTNLFETGRVEFALDPASLLRGKVYIQEASAASIALGRPRATSGALPQASSGAAAPKPGDAQKTPSPDAQKTPSPDAQKPPSPDAQTASASAAPEAQKASPPAAPIVDLSRFDAGVLLEREKSKLESLAAYDKAGAAYDEAANRWKDRAASSKKGVAELSASSKTVLAIDPKGIKSPQEAMKAASDVKSLADSSKSTMKEAGAVASGLRADLASAAALEKEARSALDRDLAYLESLVDFRSGAATGILEPIILQLLSGEGRKYFHYGEVALGTALSLAKKPGGDKAAEKAKKAGLGRGRDVSFAAASLPSFRLGHLGASFLQEHASWKVDIREISSDPSLVPTPSSLAVSMSSGRESADVRAVVDLRKELSKTFSVEASAKGYALDLGKSFASAGIGGFTGRASGKLELLGEAEGGFAASGAVEVGEATASGVSGPLGEALASGLASVGSVKVDIGYEHPRSGEDRYSVRTNLDSLVAKALKALAARYADKAVADIKSALRAYAGRELEGKLGSKGDLDKLLASSLGDDKSASSVVKALDGKAKALESRAKELGAKAVENIKPPADVKAPKGMKVPKL